MSYEELIRAIGPGFHVDTPGRHYISLPDGVTPEMVDDVVTDAFNYVTSPYDRALKVFEEENWVRGVHPI